MTADVICKGNRRSIDDGDGYLEWRLSLVCELFDGCWRKFEKDKKKEKKNQHAKTRAALSGMPPLTFFGPEGSVILCPGPGSRAKRGEVLCIAFV